MSTTVKLGVKADTSSARKSLRDLDKEVQKMQEQANVRREKYRKKKERQAQTEEPDSSAPTSQGLNIPGLGKISNIEDILGKISPAAAAATKAVSAFGGTIGACAGAAGAFVAVELSAAFAACNSTFLSLSAAIVASLIFSKSLL